VLVTPLAPKTAKVAADPRFTGDRVPGGGGGRFFANAGETANAAQRRNTLSFFMDPPVWLVVAGAPALIGLTRAIPTFTPGKSSNSLFM
jgi:hypothetical protein